MVHSPCVLLCVFYVVGEEEVVGLLVVCCVRLCGCGAPSFLRPSSTVGSQIRVRELKQDWIKIFFLHHAKVFTCTSQQILPFDRMRGRTSHKIQKQSEVNTR